MKPEGMARLVAEDDGGPYTVDVADELVEAGAWALHRSGGHANWNGGLCARCPIEARAVLEGALALIPSIDEVEPDSVVAEVVRQRDKLLAMLDAFDRYASSEGRYNGSPFQAEVRALLKGGLWDRSPQGGVDVGYDKP